MSEISLREKLLFFITEEKAEERKEQLRSSGDALGVSSSGRLFSWRKEGIRILYVLNTNPNK
ncbi:MAG: hypothetical protein KAG34_06655 [Cocleimonas sp.]|nr:hypothetical protein [Cocleimonas sp.]